MWLNSNKTVVGIDWNPWQLVKNKHKQKKTIYLSKFCVCLSQDKIRIIVFIQDMVDVNLTVQNQSLSSYISKNRKKI